MKRILIVEDNVARCLELSDLLNEFGFETGVADTSIRALNMLSEADPLPDLILLDITMPHADGLRLREVLACHPRYSIIPVVQMSGTTVSLVQEPEESHQDDSAVNPHYAAQLMHEVITFLH